VFQLPIGKKVVSVDTNYFRPTEVDLLIGVSSKARKVLGWKPKYDLSMLVSEMMVDDISDFRKMDVGFCVSVEPY
jgi:GDPmannose 4,6-dehydratase